MTVQTGPGEIKTKALKDKKYPVVEGLTAGTTTQEGRVKNLEAEDSNVRRVGRKGFQ